MGGAAESRIQRCGRSEGGADGEAGASGAAEAFQLDRSRVADGVSRDQTADS